MVVAIGGGYELSFVSASGPRAVFVVQCSVLLARGALGACDSQGTRRFRGATDVVLLVAQSPAVIAACDCMSWQSMLIVGRTSSRLPRSQRRNASAGGIGRPRA